MSSSTQLSENELASSFDGQQIAKLLRTAGPIVSCVLLSAVSTKSEELKTVDKKLEEGQSLNTVTDDESAKISVTDSNESVDVPKDDTAHNADSNDNEPTTTPTPTTMTTTTVPSTDNNSTNTNDHDTKSNNQSGSNDKTERIILKDQISQIMVDTTPKKSMVTQILGGPFTFLGQYEDEGIVVMIRRQPENANCSDNDDECDDSGLVINPHQLQPPLHSTKVYGDILLMRVAPCEDENEEDNKNDGDDDKNENENDQKEEAKETNEKEKETATATATTKSASSPVSDDDEQLNPTETTTSKNEGPKLLSNEEFFLDYTMEEYIKFASRTDIVPPPEKEVEEEQGEEETEAGGEEVEPNSNSEEEEDADDDDDDEEEDDDYEDDDIYDEDDEDCQISMMNLILGQIIKRFREEHGRGPNTEELLAIKSALAVKLGIEVSIDGVERGNDDDDDDDNDSKSSAKKDDNDETRDDLVVDNSEADDTKPGRNSNKRKSDSEDRGREKRVKFTNKDDIRLIAGLKHLEDDDDDIVLEDGEEEI